MAWIPRVHGFSIRGLKIDVQIPRGRASVTVEFTAPPPGRYEIACSEFCGTGHPTNDSGARERNGHADQSLNIERTMSCAG